MNKQAAFPKTIKSRVSDRWVKVLILVSPDIGSSWAQPVRISVAWRSIEKLG
jgi:hypothetical protein